MNRTPRFSLFWRIFLSIWFAMAITVLVSNLVTRQLIDRERESIERQVGLQQLAQEALNIRESEGRGAAWRFLREQGKALQLHLVLVDGNRHDQGLPDAIRERMQGGWQQHRPAVVSVEGGYRLVAWPRLGGEGWLDPRLFEVLEVAVAFVLITLACWWIARLISRPLNHMEITANAIAGGKTALRVSERIARRRDEVGALARAFNAMTEQLCNLLERQKHLLRDISHDLRTPLARQRVAIELASDGALDAGLLASILRQNERLEAMTSQILSLYRISEKGTDIERQSLKVVAVINQVLRDASDYAEHRGVDCKLSTAPDSKSVMVLGDLELLRRAFDNILQNALDHTPPGRAVRVELQHQAGQLHCGIIDGGPGVEPGALPHLFEPFYRADSARSGQGWGLGLAVARDIIRAHDGDIMAANSDAGGLRVTIILPVFTHGS